MKQIDATTKLELETFAMWLMFELMMESIRGEKPKLSSDYVNKYLSR